MRLGLLPRTVVHCLLPTEEIVTQLREVRPDVLVGYPSILTDVADTVIAGGLRDLRPRFVAVGGETGTAGMKQRIRRAFEAPVYSVYGAEEFNLVAWGCPRSGLYHVCDENLILEVLRGGRPVDPGEEGEVVGTPLHSLAAPLIRYPPGDLAVRGPAPCPCGAPYSTLLRVEGGTLDVFSLPGGRVLYPFRVVAPLLEQAPWLRRCQLVQRDLDRFELLGALMNCSTTNDVEPLAQSLRAVLGDAVHLDIRMVEEIPVGPGGKYQPFQSVRSTRHRSGVEVD